MKDSENPELPTNRSTLLTCIISAQKKKRKKNIFLGSGPPTPEPSIKASVPLVTGWLPFVFADS